MDQLPRFLYLILVALLAIQRLTEIIISKRNHALTLAEGGKILYREQFKWMVLMHVIWFICCSYSGLISKAFPPLWIATCAVIVLLGCQWVRFLSMRELKTRWSTQILVVPGKPIIRTGIYSKTRHPNYLIIVIEVFIVPALCLSWTVAVVFSAWNSLVLWVRIQSEERALQLTADYDDYMKTVPRFI